MIRVGQNPQPSVWVWKMHRDSEPRKAVLPMNRQSGAKSSCKLQVNSQHARWVAAQLLRPVAITVPYRLYGYSRRSWCLNA